MTTIDQSPLGKTVSAPSGCDPSVLFAIPRDASGPRPAMPFIGQDVWNAWELGWLDAHGKPRVAVAELRIPADSPVLIESKSLKLYLQGYAPVRFADPDAVGARIRDDLTALAGVPVTVALHGLDSTCPAFAAQALEGNLIDDVAVAIDHYGPPQPGFLCADAGEVVEETLVSDLLKSNCPVTGQPDWASLQIRYLGPRIDRTGLLRYIVSFREHRQFHEACVERIFADLMQRCMPQRLTVYARYTRRGGLDINPFRATPGSPLPTNRRSLRQ